MLSRRLELTPTWKECRVSISEPPGALPVIAPVATERVPTDHGSTDHRWTDPAPQRAARALAAPARVRWPDRQPWRDALTALGLVSVALLFLEAVADILPDGTWFWLVTPSRAVLILGLVAMALVAPRPGAWRTWIDVPLALLVVVGLVASFGRPDSMALWRWLLTEVGFFYLVVMVRRLHRDTHRAALVLGLTGVATAALVALQQAAEQTPTGFCRAPAAGMADGCEQPGALVRVIGTFANPNLLAAFLLVLLPLAWLAVDEWLNRSMRLAGWAVIALASLALLQTWSRAGIAAGLLGALALFTLLQPYGRRLRHGGLLLLAGIGGAILVVAVSGAGVRTSVWTESFRLAAANPLGVGLGRAGALLDEAIPGDLQFQHAHNTWLNWLIETGWLGFLAVLTITGLVCWRTWRSAREGSRIAAACGAGLLGVGLMSLADHPANSLRVAMVMALVIGLLMSSPLADQSIRSGLPEQIARFIRLGAVVRPVRPVRLAARVGRARPGRRADARPVDRVPPPPVVPVPAPLRAQVPLDSAPEQTGPRQPVATATPTAGFDPWATTSITPQQNPWAAPQQPQPSATAADDPGVAPPADVWGSGTVVSQPSPWRAPAPRRVQTGSYDEH